MSELDIARLLNDKVVDFGNERFLEGWNGATERIIKLLEDELGDCVCEQPLQHLTALIKGEK